VAVPAPNYASHVDYADLGPLVPDEVAADVIKTLPQSSAAVKLLRTVRMSARTLTQPVLASLPVAYWVNGSTGLKQTTELSWDGVTLTAEEIAVIVPIPDVVIDDAGFPIWAEVRPLIAEAIGLKLDQAVFSGIDSPASWPDGIIPQAIAAGNTSAVDSTPAEGGLANDLLGAFDPVEADGYDVTGIAADRSIKSGLRKARDTTGQKIIDVSTGEIEGVPIEYVGFNVFDPATSGGTVAVVGDFNMAILGIRQDITYKLLDQAVISDDAGKVILNLAQQDAQALRVVARFGFAKAKPVTRSDSATPYPFAVLQDAGGAGAMRSSSRRASAKASNE